MLYRNDLLNIPPALSKKNPENALTSGDIMNANWNRYSGARNPLEFAYSQPLTTAYPFTLPNITEKRSPTLPDPPLPFVVKAPKREMLMRDYFQTEPTGDRGYGPQRQATEDARYRAIQQSKIYDGHGALDSWINGGSLDGEATGLYREPKYRDDVRVTPHNWSIRGRYPIVGRPANKTTVYGNPHGPTVPEIGAWQVPKNVSVRENPYLAAIPTDGVGTGPVPWAAQRPMDPSKDLLTSISQVPPIGTPVTAIGGYQLTPYVSRPKKLCNKTLQGGVQNISMGAPQNRDYNPLLRPINDVSAVGQGPPGIAQGGGPRSWTDVYLRPKNDISSVGQGSPGLAQGNAPRSWSDVYLRPRNDVSAVAQGGPHSSGGAPRSWTNQQVRPTNDISAVGQGAPHSSGGVPRAFVPPYLRPKNDINASSHAPAGTANRGVTGVRVLQNIRPTNDVRATATGGPSLNTQIGGYQNLDFESSLREHSPDESLRKQYLDSIGGSQSTTNAPLIASSYEDTLKDVDSAIGRVGAPSSNAAFGADAVYGKNENIQAAISSLPLNTREVLDGTSQRTAIPYNPNSDQQPSQISRPVRPQERLSVVGSIGAERTIQLKDNPYAQALPPLEAVTLPEYQGANLDSLKQKGTDPDLARLVAERGESMDGSLMSIYQTARSKDKK
jgi:hypothetical protein